MAKRDVPEINSSSMADIAFMLLIFFLVATTMDIDTGLARMLPPPVPEEQEDTPPIKERNVFVVLVNKNNQLLVEGRPMRVDDLKDACKEFILNPRYDETLPETKTTNIPLIGDFEVSKGVVSLQNDRGTQYGTYLVVQNALVAAYNEVRDELSMEKFGKNFDRLNESQADAIKKAIPQRISEAEPKNVGGK
jgi:biopolymer transport protein ExbD